jgi:hypothetical protein
MASNEAPGRAFCRSLDPPAIEAYTQSQGLAPAGVPVLVQEGVDQDPLRAWGKFS